MTAASIQASGSTDSNTEWALFRILTELTSEKESGQMENSSSGYVVTDLSVDILLGTLI